MNDVARSQEGINKEEELVENSSITPANKVNTNNGDVEITCKVCFEKTTYRDFDKHKNTPTHASAYATLQKKNRRERKIRMKNKKMTETKTEAKPKVIRALPYKLKSEDKSKVKETFQLRGGDSLPELHHLYIVTLSTFLALRCSLSKDEVDRDFKLSIINSDWNEFGDIVIEFCDKGLVDEIQAIQCKQVQTRNDISISTLAAENGKFSIKTRCDILHQLKKRKKNLYDRACFKLFTLSSLPVNKNDIPKFVYDDEAIKQWKSNKNKKNWKGKQLKIPEYKKKSLLNTTDDPDDICIFKIVDKDNKQVFQDLNKFSMFTNQRKLESLKSLMTLTLKNKFDNCEPFTDELIKYVSEHFNQKLVCRKISKSDFLLKIAELILKSYFAFPESVTFLKSDTNEANWKTWNNTLQKFDLIAVKKESNIIEKIHKCFGYVLREKTQFSADNGKLIIEKKNVPKSVSSVLFDTDEETIAIPLLQAYLALWKAQCIPMLLSVSNENELNTINKIITLLHETHITVNFILITDLKIDRSVSKNLKIFLNLNDLQNETSQIDLDNLKNIIKIKVCDVLVPLEEIVGHNPHFLEKVSPDVLLNMLLNEYSFQYVDALMDDDVIADDAVVLSKQNVEKIRNNFRNEDEETQATNLSYVVNMKGKPVHVKVPPVL